MDACLRSKETLRCSRSSCSYIPTHVGPVQRKPRHATRTAAAKRDVQVNFKSPLSPEVAVPRVASFLKDYTEGSLSSVEKNPLRLSWAGAGIFFFWQLGALKYLAERYDLSKVPMVGASGGAIASMLAICGVDADTVLVRAYERCTREDVFENPARMLGGWGAKIAEFLSELLPDDAYLRCRGKVTFIVSVLPTMEQIGITEFTDNEDLIKAAMASSHIPFIFDRWPAYLYQGKFCMDGSFPDFFANKNSIFLTRGSPVLFDYFMDSNLERKGRLDFLRLRAYDEIKQIMAKGYDYAHMLHEEGSFAKFDLGEIMLPSIKSMEEAQNE